MSHCYGMLLRIFKFLGLFQFFHSEKTKRSYVTLLLQISWRQNNQKDSSLQPPVQKRQLPETWQEGNAFPTPQTVGSARTGHWRSQTNTFGETLGSSYCFPPVLATTAGFCSGVGLIAWGFLDCCSLPDPAAAPYLSWQRGCSVLSPFLHTVLRQWQHSGGKSVCPAWKGSLVLIQEFNIRKYLCASRRIGMGVKKGTLFHKYSSCWCLYVLSCCWQYVCVFSQQCRMLDAVWWTYRVEVTLPRCGLMPQFSILSNACHTLPPLTHQHKN